MSSERSRAEQRDHLFTGVGFLLDPIRRMIENLDAERSKIAYIDAQFDRDFESFNKELMSVCQSGPLTFTACFLETRRALYGIAKVLKKIKAGSIDKTKAGAMFEDVLFEAQAAIRDIPCDDPGTILPGESPFQTYLRLRAVCAGAAARLDILDPWLSADVFHRFLADVAQTAQITVVTHEKVMLGNDTMRRDRIVAVSELVARERPTTYRLLVSGSLHDRHCRADDTILHLGGSAVHASFNAPYTISTLGPTNHAALDAMIAGADEWFGPRVTTHRRS